MAVKPKQKTKEDYPIGTVFNPHCVAEGYRVRFMYESDCAFEVTLLEDGRLDVRMSGARSDLISTHHHVANNCILVPRRYDNDKGDYVEFVKPQ